jgi:hypothetical protein
MGDEGMSEGGEEKKGGSLGFDALAMNVVPAAATAEPSELGRRKGHLVLWVVGVVAAAAIVVLGFRVVGNLRPGQEAEDRLLRALQESPETARLWERAVVMDARYVAGDRVQIDFPATIRAVYDATEEKLVVPDEADREKVRSATRAVMEVLVRQRPGRDLYVDGYQGDKQIVEAVYRQHGSAAGGERGAKGGLDIVVRVAGDPKAGMGETYAEKGKPRARGM